MRLCQFRHRLEIVLDHFESGWSGVPRDVVCSRENDDRGRFEIDDIGKHPYEHLWRGLSADAAIDEGLT